MGRPTRLLTFQRAAIEQHRQRDRRDVAAHRIDARIGAGHVQLGADRVPVPFLHRVEAARDLPPLGDSGVVSPRDGVLFLKHADDCAQSVGQRHSPPHVRRFHPLANDHEEIWNHVPMIELTCSLCESKKNLFSLI